MEPLALASVQLKGATIGVVSKADGTYELEVPDGEIDVVFTMLGYKPQVIHLVMTANYVQHVIMEVDARDLSEVVVRGKRRDRSEEYIRNVIRHKEELTAAAGSYSCNVYVKAAQQDSSRRKVSRKPPFDLRADADLQGMSMAEISLRYDHGDDGRVKEERIGVVKRGNPEALFFLSLTEADFNLYNNLLTSRTLSQVPFLSPVSYGGLAAYRYKLLDTRQQGARKIYTIGVRPRQLSNVTVEGEIRILDSTWVVLDARFRLPSYHIPEYDFFEVALDYDWTNGHAWMLARQEFTYYSKHGTGKLSGKTIASLRDFELNKSFPKKYFGPELSSTAQEAYERDSSFWEKTRTEPLTAKELRFIRYKDSIFRVTHSKPYLDSIDRETNRITWKKLLLFGQSFYYREKERTWVLPPAIAIYDPFNFGGARLGGDVFYSKVYRSKKTLLIHSDISYGLRNRDVNGGVDLTRMYNPFSRALYGISLQRDFYYIFEGDAWINMLKRNNFYLHNGIQLNHGLEVLNGLYFSSSVDFAFRRSVSDYKTNPRVDSLFGDILDDNEAVDFESYNAVYAGAYLSYTPFQRYIREPKEKINLGSQWPTFYTSWRKGIRGPLSSKVDFDYWEIGIQQELKLGITGVSKYRVLTGSFLNTKDLRMVDYKFQRRGDPLLFMNPNEAFQSLDSTFPVFKRFYQGHYVHEFNGAILNKIPFLKKLQLREVAGAGFLLAPERDLRYAEAFAGVERVFKWPFNPLFKFKMGIYVVGSAANQFRNPVQLKIGFTSWDRKRNKWL